MKYIAVILATYLLISAFIPSHGTMMCCSSTCCDSEISQTSDTNSEDQNTDQKSCPPQCASICCNVLNAISPKANIPLVFLTIKPFVENTFHYNSPRGIPFQNIVWQPPKVS